MMNQIVQEAEFRYIEAGEGQPIIILHGLMGGLSNFEGVMSYFPSKGYKILVPELPVYDMSLGDSTVKSLADFLDGFSEVSEITYYFCFCLSYRLSSVFFF